MTERVEKRVEVQAGGGVIWRMGTKCGKVKVLLVHRPKYGDWSLPKGKLEKSETLEQCALREVEEETGLLCELGSELPGTFYTDSRGRYKHVRYWAMTVIGGEFIPNKEVDQVKWVRVNEAKELLSYKRELNVIAGLAEQ